jgi:hypothetical protein
VWCAVLQSNSSRLVTGAVTAGGTGIHDLMQPLVLERSSGALTPLQVP